MDENQFFAYRSVLHYLRKKDYSQFMASKELKDVLNVEVSVNWVKKWWNAPIEQLAGRAGKGGGQKPQNCWNFWRFLTKSGIAMIASCNSVYQNLMIF